MKKVVDKIRNNKICKKITMIFMYVMSWQISTPLYTLIYGAFRRCGGKVNILVQTIIANLIGCIIFYPVNKYIFKNKD